MSVFHALHFRFTRYFFVNRIAVRQITQFKFHLNVRCWCSRDDYHNWITLYHNFSVCVTSVYAIRKGVTDLHKVVSVRAKTYRAPVYNKCSDKMYYPWDANSIRSAFHFYVKYVRRIFKPNPNYTFRANYSSIYTVRKSKMKYNGEGTTYWLKNNVKQ